MDRLRLDKSDLKSGSKFAVDPFTHSLVGLTAAKAGLGRLSPLATTVCVIAANAPDCDIVVGFLSDRWEYLHHHRGLTHSIVGVLALGILLPTIVFAADRIIAAVRRRKPQVQYRGLLLASLLVIPTHPLLDWTNNYGVRPFLPWNGQWFYGDLAFVVDPYILLAVGGAAFLATSDRWPKIIVWSIVAAAIITLSIIIQTRPDPRAMGVNVARGILLAGILVFGLLRAFKITRGREKMIAIGVLAGIVIYCGALAVAHRAAYRQALTVSESLAAHRSERVVRVAAMPLLANPFQWSCVAETDRALYKFAVGIGPDSAPVDGAQLEVEADQANTALGLRRFEKPNDRANEIIAVALHDRRARILLGFARFPLAHVENENCIGQTLVQFADVRYTEPGATRGTFSINIPVECPTR